MTSVTTDRRFGVNGNLAFKAPARVATTANITLSGLQTIDGVTTVADDRVLVKDQTTTTENGLYSASSGTWTRCVDANGNRDLANGTLFHVTSGTVNAGRIYKLVGTDPITPGTSAVTFSVSLTAGISTLSFLQAGTGAVARDAQSKMREVVSVADFGAVGNGATDDTSVIQAAIDSLGAGGGRVIIPLAFRCLIDNNLTVKPNVSLEGPHEFVGSPATNTSAPYGSVGGALLVNSAKTITLQGSASLTGLLIHRKSMTFPAADSSAFAGTAITSGGDDNGVSRCMILGFNKAYLCSGYQRPRLVDLNIDCLSGVEITNCFDIPYLDNIHCWPFATIAALGSHATLERSGNGIYLHDVCDFATVVNCFTYGYLIGFKLKDVNSVTLLGCKADSTISGGVPQYATCNGFEVTGASYETRLLGCKATSQGVSGVHVNTTAGIHVTISDLDAVTNGTNGVLVDAGDVSVVGGTMRNTPNGIAVSNANSRVFIDFVRFNTMTTLPISVSTISNNVHIGEHCDFSDTTDGVAVAGSNVRLGTIAGSSGLVNLPASGGAFNISTGTTGVATLAGGWGDRTVKLLFASTMTITNSTTGGTNSIRCPGGANFAATIGSALTLTHNSFQWWATGHST